MTEPQTRFFVAAYRGYYSDGETYLQLVTPKSGHSFHVRESHLNSEGIMLGNFCTAKIGYHDSVTDFKHTTHKEGLTFEVEGPRFAYATVDGECVNDSGIKIFKTAFFGKVVDMTQSTVPGMYQIKVHALSSSEKKGACSAFAWGATTIRATGPSLEVQLRTMDPYGRNRAPNPAPVTQPYIPRGLVTPVAHSPAPTVPLHAQRRQEGYGAQSIASPSRQYSGNQVATPAANTNKGAGAHAQPPNKKVHEGFKAESSAPKVISGFKEANPTENTKKTFKALVYFKTGPNKNGKTKHFVWLLGECKKALASTVDVYEPGVVFEGEFKIFDPTKPDEWSCTKVIKPLPNYFTGRLDQGHIEVDITIDRYVPAGGSSKFPHTFHWQFGLITDNKGKLPTICAGKKIAIQQRKMDGGDYEWVVTKVYP